MNTDCKSEVLRVHPNAVYVYFENSEIKHHIRLYDGNIPKSIGRGNSEKSAWIGAYLELKQNNKL